MFYQHPVYYYFMIKTSHGIYINTVVWILSIAKNIKSRIRNVDDAHLLHIRDSQKCWEMIPCEVLSTFNILSIGQQSGHTFSET